MLKHVSAQSLFMGLLVAFIGFASSFAVVLHGFKAVGASDAQAASGVMALSIAMGIAGILLSLWTRMPLSVAWSTPAGALLASTTAPEGGFAMAGGAFVVSALLVVLAGLIRPLGRAVGAIPAPLANAMLAGIILPLCFAPFKAMADMPALGAPIILVWALVGAYRRLYAVPAALIAFVVVLVVGVPLPDGAMASLAATLVPQPAFLLPGFSWQAIVSIGLPVFIVTMASQNIPGIAVLKVHGYNPNPGPLFAVTGLFSLACIPFCGQMVNMAAVTAGMAAGQDAHPDPARRYWAAVIAGVGYIILGLLAGTVTAFVGLAPPILIEAVAGLALISAFAGAALNALRDEETREAAAITFLITASGLTFLGISGAFWGIIGGVAMLSLKRLTAGSARV